MRIRTLSLAALGAAGLALSACETVEETVADTVEDGFTANMTGAQVAGGGDPDGSGRAEVTVLDKADRICYELDLRGIGQPTSVAIHRGAAGQNGPVVLGFETPNGTEAKGCTSPPEGVADAIEANVAGHYVMVHTAEFPNGAIRGQLTNRDD